MLSTFREHPLTQAQITRYLAEDFWEYKEKLPGREAIRSTLLDLKNAEEYPVYCLEEQRLKWNDDDKIKKADSTVLRS